MLRRRGAAEAGAIFIKLDRLDGTAALFGTARPRAVPSPASAASEAVPSVLPPPRPVDPGTRPLQDADATPQPGPAPRPAGPARKAGEADGAGKDDAIGQFLKAGAQAAGPGRKTEIATGNADDSLGQFLRNGGAGKSSADGDRIVAAQRALSRLGYSVKVDGVMGGTTKRAIERFERDHHLAAKGELTSGLLRQLLLAAGASAE
ncbi:MAG: DUF1491 family protein [Methylobacteriaceae bacterium]|nr:DUF1491 family protein [Methylobacteriaceae bacterium]